MITFAGSQVNPKNDKVSFNQDGGLMIKMVNKTGANSIKGTVLKAGSVSGSVISSAIGVPDSIGVFYEAGIPDGESAWVVISGVAEVLYIGNTTSGHLARTFITAESGALAGKALSEAVPTSPFASDKHFCEIGHVIESRIGAGLAKTILHFN